MEFMNLNENEVGESTNIFKLDGPIGRKTYFITSLCFGLLYILIA